MTAHWGVPDPAHVEGSDEQKMHAFREAFMTLDARVRLFVALPFASLERLALHQQLKDIGKVLPG